jgi:hypothetical protein
MTKYRRTSDQDLGSILLIYYEVQLPDRMYTVTNFRVLFYINFLAPRILRWFLDFPKNRTLLHYSHF